MKAYLLIDFGSTYTKVTAIDLESETVLGTAQSSTTIEDDVRIGMNKALDELEKITGLSVDDYVDKYASSSAAGGLKMISIGLVPALTLEAATRAACGAGAKVIGGYGFELSKSEVRKIVEANCDIVMLAGGTNGGNKQVILANAEKLAESDIDCPILVCGNVSVQDDVQEILEEGGKQVYVCDNVLPAVDEVNIGPAQEIIRQIFVKHITKAKGLEHAVEFVGRDIIPTPKATLNAAELIAEGSKNEHGMGSVLILEVGGATINVHSVEEVHPVTAQTVLRGLPENRVKRTVEGDLGIRWNSDTICELVGADTLCENMKMLAPDVDSTSIDPKEYTHYLRYHTYHTPQNAEEWAFDVALAYSAADVAVRRHAGEARRQTISIGEIDVQYGKTLLDVKTVIGVGGIFRYGENPERVLPAAKFDMKHPESLRPLNPDYYIDKNYIVYAVGLLSQDHPDEALRIAKKYLVPVDKQATGHKLEFIDFPGRIAAQAAETVGNDIHDASHGMGALMGNC